MMQLGFSRTIGATNVFADLYAMVHDGHRKSECRQEVCEWQRVGPLNPPTLAPGPGVDVRVDTHFEDWHCCYECDQLHSFHSFGMPL